MRITNKLINDNAVFHMDENLQRMYELQEKVASGKQFQRPSDNPSGVAMALSLRSTVEASQGYLNTTQSTEDWMAATDFALGQLSDTVKRAIKLVQDGISDTQGADERAALGTEVDALITQALQIGNTKHQGNYIFSGFRTTTESFTAVTNAAGDITSVTYNGDSQFIQRSVGPGQTITQNVDGNTAFSPLFQALITARDHLRANQSGPLTGDAGALQNIMKSITDQVTTNGARQRQVQLMGERMEATQTELKSLLSKKQDVNMTEAISDLRYQETVYQTVLEVGNRAISAMSLFDKLG